MKTEGKLFASTSSNSTKGGLPPLLLQFDPETGALVKTIGIVRTTEGIPTKMSDLAIQPGTDQMLFSCGQYTTKTDQVGVDVLGAAAHEFLSEAGDSHTDGRFNLSLRHDAIL